MSVREVVDQMDGRERREILKILDKKPGHDEDALGGHLCETPGCGKATPSALQCPECKKLNIGGFFCSQECFHGNWSSHCSIHKETRRERRKQKKKKNEQAEVDEEEVEKPLLTLGSRRERCGLFIAIFDCYVDDNKLLSCG